MSLDKELRVVPDFPKPGIEFLDISPLLEDAKLFQQLISSLAEKSQDWNFDKIVAIESRGFILGSALAQAMGKGFVMVRKKGKLPGETVANTYDLEYGTDTIEMLPTSIHKDEKVMILDDVLATGGTAAATCELVEKLGGQIVGCLFFIELSFLKGREKLKFPTEALVIR
ncbi:MAG: adenine phosphoribosyltransferase [Bdellovibrionales bacterium]|nr:adenine phosphoribosyltransferase [Bdellovibrionales bacterium]